MVRLFSSILIASALFVSPLSSQVYAACFGSYQRMQVGVLPDVFVNYTDEIIFENPEIPGSFGLGRDFEVPGLRRFMGWPRGFTLPLVRRDKIFDHFWTANLDLPGPGDCNVYGRTTLSGVSMANTYSVCASDVINCDLVEFPGTAVVGPAIDDIAVKKWPMRVLANPSALPQQIGGIYLYGLDCQGDVCEPPPCLSERLVLPSEPCDEFRGCDPDPQCIDFDPDYEGWQSTGPGVGDVYLLGRGNLYLGPRQPPAFDLTAETDSLGIEIDHWITNDNPRAVILITPKGEHTGAMRYFGVRYDSVSGRWSIVAESEDTKIPSGSQFNVYVSGDRGPSFQLSSTAGSTNLELDDPLLNNNPNATLLVTHVVSRSCRTGSGGGPVDSVGMPAPPSSGSGAGDWRCEGGFFPHPIGVEYQTETGRWHVVSVDGTPFLSPVILNVFRAGLPGTYRSDNWLPDSTPDYAGRLEMTYAPPTGHQMALPLFNLPQSKAIVFITQNVTPSDRSKVPLERNLHPVGVTFDGKAWKAQNLDGEDMTFTGFNVLSPLDPP